MLYLFSFCFATFYLWNNYTLKHSFKKSSYRSCLLLCFFKSIIQALSCDPTGCHVGNCEWLCMWLSLCSHTNLIAFLTRPSAPFLFLDTRCLFLPCAPLCECTHTHTQTTLSSKCINKDWAEVKYCDIWYLKKQNLNSRAVIKGADVWLLTNEIFYVKLLVH